MSRFGITYTISPGKGESLDEKILGIILEQSVELPYSLVTPQWEEQILGHERERQQLEANSWKIVIDWPVKNAGNEWTQFLNILYGNISMQRGIRIDNVEWENLPAHLRPGPKFGMEEVRQKLNLPDRPLSCIPLKPMGTSPADLAQVAYEFAKGGIDLIKDDHGLANQEYAPFRQRVERVVSAIRKAKAESGHRARYFPHISGDAGQLAERYMLAGKLGADGVMICPHLTGLPNMAALADSNVKLPIIAHPSLSGALVTNPEQGMHPAFLYGSLWRAFGADFSIYANAGGRFPFTESQSRAIAEFARDKTFPFKTTFPMPGGGIKRESLDYWLPSYGKDVVMLIGGSLYKHPKGKTVAAEEIRTRLEAFMD